MPGLGVPSISLVIPSTGLLAIALVVSPLRAQSPGDRQTVTLTRVPELACEEPGGWSNLFFEGDPGAPSGAVATFAVLQPDVRIEVVSRRTPDGELVSGVRSSAGSDEVPLAFSPVEMGRCATAEVPVDVSGAPVRLQVSLADDYVYGRVAEHREGYLATAAGRVRIELHPRMRAAVGFDDLSKLRLFVDGDLDGVIRPESELTAAGELRLGDEVGEAFVIGDERFRIDSVSAGGARLHFSTMGDVPAAFSGFRAPAFTGSDLDGEVHRLSDHRGRVVVLELWSTECMFSERARPEMILLVEALERAGGTFLSMARESDPEIVREHRRDHPRPDHVLVREDATWERWNPETVTPLYYVIDADGTILLREWGSEAVELVAAAAGISVPETSGSSP